MIIVYLLLGFHKLPSLSKNVIYEGKTEREKTTL